MTIARVVHLCGAVGWVGAIWFVARTLLPTFAPRADSAEAATLYRALIAREASQARIWIALLGVSGVWMLGRAQQWPLLADWHYWWLHVMVVVWLLFAIILFVLEPLARRGAARDGPGPVLDLKRQIVRHRVLSIVALATLIAGIGGSHGLF